MFRISRLSLSLAALGFGFYHLFLGLVSLGEYQRPELSLAASAIYLIALLGSVLDMPGIKMRPITAFLSMVAVVTMPHLVFEALGEVRQGSYATWHVAAVATLLAILSVRQFQLFAWLGFLVLSLEVIMWGGADVIFNSGLVGALLLVVVAQAASWALSSSSAAAARFQQQAIDIAAATEASSAARAERQARVDETLNEVRPLLEEMVATGGKLSAKSRLEAVTKEAELRDQIRGRNLVDPSVVLAVRSARERGIEVQLLDDGGLDDLTESERAHYYQQIVEKLASVTAGKVVIRASQGETWRLTIAALRKDEDRPDLFVRI